MKTTHCRNCQRELSFWEGVSCGNGTYDLCDDCYEDHIPNVYHAANDGVGETDEPLD